MEMKPELLLDLNCIIAEGPVWDEEKQALHFVDLLGNKLFTFAEGNLDVMEFDQNIGCACLRETGGLIAGMQHGLFFVDPLRQTIQQIADPEADRPNNRFNDGKVDPAGRLWAGTMSKDLDTGYGSLSPEGKLYCMDADLTWKAKLEQVTLSNGLEWSPDGTKFYYIDTPTGVVQVFDFDVSTGEISNGRVAIRIPADMGNPDGMCGDSAGNLYIALWGGACVSAWNPETGSLLDVIAVPAPNVTSCCFGGADMDELYITTASIGTDLDKHPHAGGIFRLKPGGLGRYVSRFKG